MPDNDTVANPGSTLGEAVGATMEREVNRLLRPLAEESGCVFLSAGRPNPRTGAATTLYLNDEYGTRYKVDSVIANARIQPLVLIESKYIRYKKHNRDKGSWIVNTHSALRRAYPTVRQSLAILAGSWSVTSKTMMQSADTTLFDVGFEHVADTLAQYGIDFRWGEKERDKAHEAWRVWQSLTDADYDAIGHAFLADIEPDLRDLLRVTLDTSIPRTVRAIEIVIKTNVGETRRYTFPTVGEALAFLDTLDVEAVLHDENGPVLWIADGASEEE